MCFPCMCEALSQEVMGVIVSGLARRRCVVDWRERERERERARERESAHHSYERKKLT